LRWQVVATGLFEKRHTLDAVKRIMIKDFPTFTRGSTQAQTTRLAWLVTESRRIYGERSRLRAPNGEEIRIGTSGMTPADTALYYQSHGLYAAVFSNTVEQVAATFAAAAESDVLCFAATPSGIVLGCKQLLQVNFGSYLDLDPTERALETDGVWKILRDKISLITVGSHTVCFNTRDNSSASKVSACDCA
jgi:hypothetical protein